MDPDRAEAARPADATTHRTEPSGPPDPTTRQEGPPPPPQQQGPPPPPTHRGGSPRSGPPRTRPTRRWRDRLPEVTATIGTVLVVVALAGFVTSTWEELSLVQRAVTLAAIAVGLTVGAVYAESAARRSLERVTSLVFLSASATTAAAGTLLVTAADPGAGRLAIAAGGLAAAVHAAWVLLRDPGSPTRALGLGVALLYAAGPPGESLGDRFSTTPPGELLVPLLGTADPTVRSDAFLAPGVAWTLIGVALLALSSRAAPRVRRTLTVLATGVLFGAALMLNVLTDPVGAFVALCLLLGYLVHGWLTDQPGVQIVGAVGVLLAGIRVLWGLFSGQLAVTVAALGVGLALLGWSVVAARGRSDEPDSPPHDEHAAREADPGATTL